MMTIVLSNGAISSLFKTKINIGDIYKSILTSPMEFCRYVISCLQNGFKLV